MCASACVLVLAGAVNRLTPGSVVVHRHFFDSIEPLQAAKAWQRTQESIRTYLREVNVPGGLLDLALEAPPEGGRPLTLEEKREFVDLRIEGWLRTLPDALSRELRLQWSQLRELGKDEFELDAIQRLIALEQLRGSRGA